MYSFIFFVMYNHQLKKGESIAYARFNGSLVSSFAIIIHILFVFALCKNIYFQFYESHLKGITKVVGGGIAIVTFGLNFFYYNEGKIKAILSRYTDDKDPTKVSNYVKLVCIIFIPLAIIIMVS